MASVLHLLLKNHRKSVENNEGGQIKTVKKNHYEPKKRSSFNALIIWNEIRFLIWYSTFFLTCHGNL